MNDTNKSEKETGTIRINPSGFGFFTPANAPKRYGLHNRKDSIYIAGAMLKGIYDGDTVTLERSGKTVNKISLVSRGRKYFIGSVGTDGKTVTMDPGLGNGTFTLTERQTPDVTVRFTLNKKHAKVTKVVGKNYSAAELYERFMYRFNLPSEPVQLDQGAAEALLRSVRNKNRYLHLRHSLKKLTAITIDNADTMDVDDALSAELCPDGAIRVWVHIADVAEYIGEDSYLDMECRKTPTSTYSPYGVRHMLPEALSTEAISLLPGKDRLVLSVEFVIGANGAVTATDVYHATVRINKKFSYEEVDKLLNDGVKAGIDPNVATLIRVLRTAAKRLGVTRDARAGIDTLREKAQGEAGEAHEIVERLMVCANESVAKWMKARNIPTPRRVHATLGNASVDIIEKSLNEMGIIAHFNKPVDPVALMAALRQVEEGPDLARMFKLIAKELGRAYYTFEEGSHFGLVSGDYLHFTSPLRRYPDLLVHRMIKKYLRDVHIGNRSFRDAVNKLTPLLDHTNSVTGEAASAENSLYAAKGIASLVVGEVHRGVVSGTKNSESVVYLDGTGVTATLLGRYAPGTRIKVRIKSANLHTLEVVVSEV